MTTRRERALLAVIVFLIATAAFGTLAIAATLGARYAIPAFAVTIAAIVALSLSIGHTPQQGPDA